MTAQKLESERYFFNPFRNPFLWAFVALHLSVAMLLGRVFAFSPDEKTYLSISHKVYIWGFHTSSEVGWKDAQTNYVRILYLPARLFELIGIPDYLAIRIISILLSAMVLYLLLCLTQGKLTKRALVSIIALFSIPSIFLWMTLGLREPYLYLSIALICTGIYRLQRVDIKASLICISLGSLVVLETKPIIFLIVLGAMILMIFQMMWRAKGLSSRQGFIAIAIAIPMLVNLQGTVGLAKTIHQELFSVTVTGSSTISSYADRNAQAAAESNFSTTTAYLRDLLKTGSNSVFVKLLKFTGLEKRLLSVSSDPYDDSYKKGSATRLNVSPASIKKPITIFKRAGAFLFTPFPFINNGSLFLNILSLESPLWWLIFIIFAVAVWRRFSLKSLDDLAVFVLSFSVVFILFSAITEINVGTLSRHRSLLLIPMVFLIVTDRTKEKSTLTT